MKIALLAVLGLILGTLGGAALGIGAGLAWVAVFQTTDFEGASGMLVFFTFMPLGAMIGGLGGAFLFGVLGAAAACLYGRHHANQQEKRQQTQGNPHNAQGKM